MFVIYYNMPLQYELKEEYINVKNELVTTILTI